MSRNTTIPGLLVLLAAWSASTLPGTASGYSLSNHPDQLHPNPALAEFRVDYPEPGLALFEDVVLLDHDTWAGFGGQCKGEASCIRIFVPSDGGVRLFEKEGPGCVPSEGDGPLGDAALIAIVDGFIRDGIIPEVKNRFVEMPGGVHINLRICDNPSYFLMYRADGSPVTPIICVLDAPAVVDLGRIATDSTRNVRSAVRCSGSGGADIRVSVLGAASISPVPGLELWATAPSGILHVTSGGGPGYVDLTVGAKVDNPEPGTYSGTFVYAIEYL